MKVGSPWRKKNYHPLSFSKGYGWRISKGQLHLSLGRGRPRIDLAIPTVLDSATGEEVDPELWGEMQLCWDRDNRRFSLHIPYETHRDFSAGDAVSAIDEGIINSMALATWVDTTTIDITIINGREARAIKRQRNKAVGQLQRKISRCKNGSRKHRRLVMAKKKLNAKTKRALRDFDHQVSGKAANHIINHNTATLIVGDVRGIERHTKVKRCMSRHGRQQLSQSSRGRQERYLKYKTGLDLDFLNESGSTKTCPACSTRNRPSGRHYRCKNHNCRFTCHRDAVGAINILQKALYGEYVPIGLDTTIRVTYLRAVERWFLNQCKAHRKVQCRKAKALSSAQNQALSDSPQTSKPKLANSSTSTYSSVSDQSVAVA
jgi:putative transposase